MNNANATPSPLQRTLGQPTTTGGSPLSLLLLSVGLILFLLLLAVSLYVLPDGALVAVAALGLGLPIAWLLWKNPEYGLLVLAFFTSGFVPPTALDVRLPIGGLDARDLTLIGVSGLLLAQAIVRGRLNVPWRWIGVTLSIFLGLAVFSVLYAVLWQKVEANWAFGELRTLAYYVTFFLSVQVIHRRKQLIILLIGLFVLADLTASTLIVQQFLGKDNPLLAAMSGGSWNVWSAYQGDPTLGNTSVLRIIPPGHVLTYVVSIIAFAVAVSEGSAPLLRIFCLSQVAYLNVGLLFTYSRAQWVASAIALLIVVILLPGRAKARLTMYGLAGALAVVFGFGVFSSVAQSTFGTQVFDAVRARASSILSPDQTLASNSLEWRLFETDEAVKSISLHPIIGLGLGAAYRPPTLLQGEAIWGIRNQYRLTRFIHDSYLYLAVKLGLSGLLAFLTFAVAVLLTGWRQLFRLRDGQLRGLNLALIASFVGFLAWSISQAHLLQVESTTVVGLIAGMIIIVGRIEGQGKALRVGVNAPPPIGDR